MVAEWVVNQEPSSMKPSIKDYTNIDGNTTSYCIHGIKTNARIRVEQDADLVLKNLKIKRNGQAYDDVLLTTDRRFKHYKANQDRIILKDGLLFRKYYGKTGSIKYYQILKPKQLVNEVFRNIHGEFGKHPGITKTIIAYGEKYYYPNMAHIIKEWVMSCEQCLRESRINPRLTRPPLHNPIEYKTAPEVALQIDLVPGLPPSCGFENFVTAIQVFSRYLFFAYPTSNQDAKTINKVVINTMTKHAYLPTTLISDKGTAFMSHVIKEKAGILGITPKRATTKHAQTIGLLERSYASIKQALNIETGERRSMWHNFVSIAVLNYNKCYHASIGCERNRVLHGRIFYKILDLKTGIRPQKIPSPDSQIAQDLLEQTEMIFQDVRKNAMQAYIKYKAYYDKKANASKLKQVDYVYILQPKADHQGSKIPFTDFQWIGPYNIEKVLPNNNYLVRKTGTNKTQILHRRRLRQFTPRQPIPDIQITPYEWKPDPEVIIKHDDLNAKSWKCEHEKPVFDSDYNNLVTPNPPEVTVQSGEAADEMSNTPGTIKENSPEVIPQTDRSYDGTDTDHYMQPDADTSVEQPDPTPTSPCSSKNDLRLNPKPKCHDYCRYWPCPTAVYGTQAYTLRKS